jgi:photosystem II stability/assembly factor-like uncharacterized protein
MRNAALILLCIFCLSSHCQITQLYTGTTVTINHLSSYNNTVLVGGLSGNFLAKSYNEGNNLIPLSCPGNTTNYSFFQRMDKDTVFLLSSGYSAELYRSVDGGNNWSKRLDTTAFIPNSFTFFDGREGIVDYGYGNQILRTLNSGAAWTLTSTAMPSITMFKSFGDSILIMGGIASPNTNGIFLFSRNRGHTWPYPTEVMKSSPSDFCFLNADTIFGISHRTIWGSTFTRSMNGGQSWQIFPEPLYNNDGMTKQNSEIYIVGSNDQNIGYIAKSVDFGQSWSTFNTGISTRLQNLLFLNDSIALISGTNGVLLRWNYKLSVFTGIPEYSQINSINVYPNPVSDALNIEFKNRTVVVNNKIQIINSIGEVVKEETNNLSGNQTISINDLPNGVYFVHSVIDKEILVRRFVVIK